jgi:hypothetical protein
MKTTIQKRIYTSGLPRFRSLYNSSTPISLFDPYPPLSPPLSPTSRHANPPQSPPRTPAYPTGKGEAQNNPNINGSPPFSLALSPSSVQQSPSLSSSPTQSHNASFFPCSSFYSPTASHIRPELSLKRQRVRYRLDVGAYGIPKSCRRGVFNEQFLASGRKKQLFTAGNSAGGVSQLSSTSEDLGLAVQVGEDAYFVRGNNAMGVADGVGGWSTVKNGGESR